MRRRRTTVVDEADSVDGSSSSGILVTALTLLYYAVHRWVDQVIIPNRENLYVIIMFDAMGLVDITVSFGNIPFAHLDSFFTE